MSLIYHKSPFIYYFCMCYIHKGGHTGQWDVGTWTQSFFMHVLTNLTNVILCIDVDVACYRHLHSTKST